ncbi:MAG: DUF493 family protein [Bacteroidota bacterium]
MTPKQDPHKFYNNLRKKLKKTSTWPAAYLYKFIVPTSDAKIDKLVKLFDNTGAVIKTRASSKGNYTSLSIHLKMKSPDAVIDKYIEVGEKIDGVISL